MWYKTARDMLAEVSEIYEKILKAVSQGKRVKVSDPMGVITEKSIEWMNEADPKGTSYIQVYFTKDWKIGIERYYESEMMQNEYGQSVQIPVDLDDPSKTIATVLTAVDRIEKS